MPEGKTAVRPFRYFPLCFIVRSGGRKYLMWALAGLLLLFAEFLFANLVLKRIP